MGFLIKYYNDLDLGFVYEHTANPEQAVATFYHDNSGEAWRFIQPPNELGSILPHPNIEDAVRAFLIQIGVASNETPLTLERY